jgi:hypothetical protein
MHNSLARSLINILLELKGLIESSSLTPNISFTQKKKEIAILMMLSLIYLLILTRILAYLKIMISVIIL